MRPRSVSPELIKSDY